MSIRIYFDEQSAIFEKLNSLIYINRNEIYDFSMYLLGSEERSKEFLEFIRDEANDQTITENINFFHYLFSDDYFNSYLFDLLNNRYIYEFDEEVAELFISFKNVKPKNLFKTISMGSRKKRKRNKKAKKEMRLLEEEFDLLKI